MNKYLSGGSGGRGRSFSGSPVTDPLLLDFSWKKGPDNTARLWYQCCMSRSGQYQVAVSGSGVFYSSNYGITWNTSAGLASGITVCCSYDGRYVYAQLNAASVYKSSDYGANFAVCFNTGVNLKNVACSGDGKYVIICDSNPSTFVSWGSSDYGATWSQFGPAGTAGECAAALSSDGKVMYYIKSTAGNFYKSADYGATWGAAVPIAITAANPKNMACSGNGRYIIIAITNNPILLSDDYGATFKNAGFNGNGNAQVCMSQDGKFQCFGYAHWDNGYIFISKDYGYSWYAKTPMMINGGIAVSDDFKYITRTVPNSYSQLGYGHLYTKV